MQVLMVEGVAWQSGANSHLYGIDGRGIKFHLSPPALYPSERHDGFAKPRREMSEEYGLFEKSFRTSVRATRHALPSRSALRICSLLTIMVPLLGPLD
jgi:hypothetical protein